MVITSYQRNLYQFRGLKLPRIGLFGMMGSGKTSFAGGLLLRSEDMANYGKNYYTDVDEGDSDIRLATDNLKIGKFPEKTPTSRIFEAHLFFKWVQKMGPLKYHTTEICVPVIDMSGETCRDLINEYNTQMYVPSSKARQDLSDLHKYVLDVDAVILILDITKAKGLFRDGLSIESYDGMDPDTEGARLLEGIMRYKAINKGVRKLQKVLVGLTKYDVVKDYLPPTMDLETAEGRAQFMARCFNHTYSKLGYHQKDLEIMPIWFDLEKKNGEIQYWSPNAPKIALNPRTGRAFYSDGSFEHIIGWLKSIGD